MSATINLEKFCQYFGTTNVFETKRQVNAVLIKHVLEAPTCYSAAAVTLVRQFVSNGRKGNILVFMTSVREIEKTCAMIRGEVPGLKVLPMYSSLPKHAQDLATGGSTSQVCIVSTNVAEASLTIPGITYVIGMCYIAQILSHGQGRLTLCCRLWQTGRGEIQPSSRHEHAVLGSWFKSLCTAASWTCWANPAR